MRYTFLLEHIRNICFFILHFCFFVVYLLLTTKIGRARSVPVRPRDVHVQLPLQSLDLSLQFLDALFIALCFAISFFQNIESV